jgi:hypothetical protein
MDVIYQERDRYASSRKNDLDQLRNVSSIGDLVTDGVWAEGGPGRSGQLSHAAGIYDRRV